MLPRLMSRCVRSEWSATEVAGAGAQQGPCCGAVMAAAHGLTHVQQALLMHVLQPRRHVGKGSDGGAGKQHSSEVAVRLRAMT